MTHKSGTHDPGTHDPGTPWHAARSIAFDAVSPLTPVEVDLEHAIGEVLARDIVALCDVPATAVSAMDGWAVAGDAPWRLVEREPRSTAALGPGEAAAILTGSPVPSTARGVLRSEHGTVTNGTLWATAEARADEPRAAEHVRPAGEEMRRGEVVVAASTRTNPAHVAVAAAAGHDALSVAARPRVALVLSGDEVVERGIPGPGFVRDSFGPQLPAVVHALGGTVVRRERVGDVLDALTASIELAITASDIVITTGGTGTSSADHLHAGLATLGAELLIDGIAMRPGHPCVLARTADGTLIAGLPGNPLAAMVGLLTVVAPALAGLRGEALPPLPPVVAAVDVRGREGHHRLLPFMIADGRAQPTAWHGPAMLRGLAEANGLLIVPPTGVSAGATAETVPLPW